MNNMNYDESVKGHTRDEYAKFEGSFRLCQPRLKFLEAG
jgi:hypothetical protein